MKIILKENIENIGKKGQIITVADGHGRNYLIPEDKAILASDKNLKLAKQWQEEEAKALEVQKNEFSALAESLKDTSLSLVKEAKDNGELYGAVKSGDIIEAAKEKTITLQKEWFSKDFAITKTGKTSITLSLPQGIPASIEVEVTA